LSKFLFIFLISSIIIFTTSDAFADATATLLPAGQVVFINDEIILDDGSTLDLSQSCITVPEFTEVIGGKIFDFIQQVQFVSNTVNNPITLQNTLLPSVIVKIPDQTKMTQTLHHQE